MIPKALCDFYIASCVEEGGAYRFRLSSDGNMEQIQKIPMPSPMYLQIEKNRLWAVLRAPFDSSKESGVAAYDLDTGKRVTDILSTGGEIACHISVDGDAAYCANYIGGSIFKTPDKLILHKGHGADPVRQTAPHPHAVFFSPDRQALLCCDLGLDRIFVYDRELRLRSSCNTPPGAGPRHLVFSKDGRYVYCIYEMGGSIGVFSYQKSTLQYIKTVSLPLTALQGAGAAIKLSADGTRLYATERTTQRILTLGVDGPDLTLLDFTDCHGIEPRDFTLLSDDRFALCANQFSDNLTLFRMDDQGVPVFLKEVPLPAPLCVVALER